jgi:hypothetical protein
MQSFFMMCTALAGLLIVPSRDSHSFAGSMPECATTANLPAHRLLEEISKTEERSFDFRPGGRVQVTGNAGFIRVESWEKNEVFLRYTKRVWDSRRREAERRMENLQVEISDQPGQLIIRQVPEFEEDHFDFFDLFDPDTWSRARYAARIDFELRVPRQCELILETDEGEITVRQIEGNVEVNSDEGDIDLDDISRGDVTAETDEGDIIALRLTAKGGSLNSDEGDIEVDAARFDEGTWHITTDEGDVELFLPASANAEIELETTDGRIRSDFKLNRISDDEDGERLTGRLGDGRARLEIYTDEGDISLRRR